MNIYIHLEVSVRELDSKLMMALIAASRGHEVMISSQEAIIKGLERKLLKPGIFHTKSLTPGIKTKKHANIVNSGCKITSIDEEGGLVDYGYKRFASYRYSNKTLNQASAVFTWGPEDYKTLKKVYPKFSKKIHLTGSPRVDLWNPSFAGYWTQNFKKKKKPFLLIPTNFGGFNDKHINDRIKSYFKGEYIQRDPTFVQRVLGREYEEFRLISSFIEAVKHLAYKNKNYDVVLRPHPSDNLEMWKILLGKIPNVGVNRDDGVSLWIKNSFAIMHNGCTTALEASFFRKPIITYVPFKANFARKLANDLGQKVNSLQQLKKKVDEIFYNFKKNKYKISSKPLPKILIKKLFVDEKETAAKKIVKVWESIDDKNISIQNNWFLFKLMLKIMKFNGLIGRLLRKNPKLQNYKFPPFEEEQIFTKMEKLKKILKIKQDLDCAFLSDRTILIKKK